MRYILYIVSTLLLGRYIKPGIHTLHNRLKTGKNQGVVAGERNNDYVKYVSLVETDNDSSTNYIVEGVLSVDLAKDNIQSADDGDNISKHVLPANVVEQCQVEESWRLDLAPVGF